MKLHYNSQLTYTKGKRQAQFLGNEIDLAMGMLEFKWCFSVFNAAADI